MLVSKLKLQGAAAVVAATVLTGGCGLMAPKVERYVAPAGGSSYVIHRRDTGSYGKVDGQVPIKVGRKMWRGSEVTSWDGPTVGVLAYPNGNWIGIFAGDKPVITWDPPLGWEWPIEVGKSWTKEYKMTNHASKRTVTYASTQKVEAHEDVTVPAGTFKAFRVSTSTTLGDENMVWFSPEFGIWVKAKNRRTDKHPAGPGSRDDELVSHDLRR
jgi:hypothetical protein